MHLVPQVDAGDGEAMKMCDGCTSLAGPTWDHAPDCPNWPGTEWSRRKGGYMGPCLGVRWCEEIHPYQPHELCGCEGECHYCSHMGCEQCVEKAWNDRPWWQRLFRRRPKSIWEWQPFG